MTSYLLDTNVLLRYVEVRHPLHPRTRTTVDNLQAAGHLLCLTPQNAIELWNVATRPTERNGFGLSPGQAERLLHQVEALFTLLPDTPAIYPLWRQLVVQVGVSGVQVHDARLVAVMQAHGLQHLVSYNQVDFARYAALGIQVVNPGTS